LNDLVKLELSFTSTFRTIPTRHLNHPTGGGDVIAERRKERTMENEAAKRGNLYLFPHPRFEDGNS